MILITSFLLSVLLLSAPGSVWIASGQGQMIGVRVLDRGDDWQCPSMEERERERNEIKQVIDSVIAIALAFTTTGSTTSIPSTATSATTTPTTVSTTTVSTTTSMTTMPSTTTSATATHITTPATAVSTAAAMTTMPPMIDCGTPGWRRVAFINMNDTSYDCPTGLNLTLHSKRTCGRSHTGYGCSSTTFSVGSLPYSRVCGRIRGYQFGAGSAFFLSAYRYKGINRAYVSGLSLTHGNADNRQHIWTFAAGVSEVTTGVLPESCPCDTFYYDLVPAFVGNDYFCESGVHSAWYDTFFRMLFADDVLWDGEDCTANSTCCQFNNPPWFTKNLTDATTDNIELRICTENSDDFPVELIELYVQ